MEAFRSFLGETLDQISKYSNYLSVLCVVDLFDFEVPNQLCRMIKGPGLKDTVFRSPSRERALIRVKDYLMSLTIDPVSIKDLCQIAGVSERTLQYTFQEYYGLTPNAYLKARRLNAVHSELKRSDPQSSSVINIASESGFWHMGQFAADYKKMFGCRPSETLYRID